jgi:hypothetical protein
MAIKKTTVASAVSGATSKASPKAKETPAQPTDQKTNWDSLLINNSSEDTTKKADGKRYVHYLNKDRLVRSAPGWGTAKGQIVEFVIFATDEDGNPLQDLPEPRFGSAQDVDYYKAKYSLQKGFFVNDSLCRNNRHRITFYKIHILNVINKPVEVQ